MLRPAVTQMITKNESCYSLVIGVAKRAREIADDLCANEQTMEEKPVKTAVDEGKISRSRYENYRLLYEEQKEKRRY